MKLNLGAGAHPLQGFVNLDKQDGWTFEDGLGGYPHESVEAITISHALMFVPEEKWTFVFGELSRVLEPGGVIRITEDATDDPKSERYGGFYDAVTLTSSKRVGRYLDKAGLTPRLVSPRRSNYKDLSLVQQWHGSSPKVFHIEGIK
jgi:ubiquinone/menaquinone biosynthesis C-methylase UbiE